jgi:hypothetical protein
MATVTREPYASRGITAAVVVVAVAATVAAAWFAYGVITDGPGPGLGFRHYTGLRWPSEVRVVRSADSHGGFLGDGEYFLVFDADPATLQGWLAGDAPWGRWERGPVPGEMGFHCKFGGSGVGWGGPVGGPPRYRGDEELVRLLGSDHVWYSARERGSGSLRWHNGDLLVLDLAAGRVWLSVWDF